MNEKDISSSSKAGKKSKKQELAANQKVVAKVATPAEILKEKNQET